MKNSELKKIRTALKEEGISSDTRKNINPTFDTIDSFNAAGGAAAFGTGPVYIGGVQYWSDGTKITKMIDGKKSLTALQALSLAATSRVDLVMIGDSNQLYNGYGFTCGLEKALITRFGCYASPIIGVGGGFSGGGIGYTASGVDNSGLANSSGAASSVSKYTILPYGHIVSGSTTASGGLGLIGGAFATEDAIDFYFASLASSTYTNGTYRAGVRLGVSPYSQIAVSSNNTSTSGNIDHLEIEKLSISADATRAGKNVEARFSIPGYTVSGPFTGLYSRAERPNANTGISTHTLYGAGGQSAWDMAKWLIDSDDSALSQFFAETRRLQLSKKLSPIIVVYINSGFNDRNEGNKPSLGPFRSLSPTSADAYVDNIRAIQSRITRIWSINGWDTSELFWLIVPSHRIADPDDSVLVSYRSAIKLATINDFQTSVIDLGALMTQAQGTANGWYAAGQNYLHLSNTGYDAMGQILVSQIP